MHTHFSFFNFEHFLSLVLAGECVSFCPRAVLLEALIPSRPPRVQMWWLPTLVVAVMLCVVLTCLTVPAAQRFCATGLRRLHLKFSRWSKGDDHADTIKAIRELAMMHQAQGRYALAEPLAREALSRARQVHGSEGLATVEALATLGKILCDLDQLVEAGPLLLEAIKTARRTQVPAHKVTLRCSLFYGWLLLLRHQPNPAEKEFRCSLAIARATPNCDSSVVCGLVNGLAQALDKQGMRKEALPLLLEALVAQRLLGADLPDTLAALQNYATLLDIMRRHEGAEGAEALYRKAIAAHRRVMGAGHPYTLCCVEKLSRLYVRLGRFDEALPLCREVLAGHQLALGEQHAHTRRAAALLAVLLKMQATKDAADVALRPMRNRSRKPRVPAAFTV